MVLIFIFGVNRFQTVAHQHTHRRQFNCKHLYSAQNRPIKNPTTFYREFMFQHRKKKKKKSSQKNA